MIRAWSGLLMLARPAESKIPQGCFSCEKRGLVQRGRHIWRQHFLEKKLTFKICMCKQSSTNIMSKLGSDTCKVSIQSMHEHAVQRGRKFITITVLLRCKAGPPMRISASVDQLAGKT